jgi:hypothetical protein
LLSGAWLLAARYETTGGVLLAVAILWLLLHTALDAARGFRDRK